jgi:hypothetical protein
MKLRTKFSFKRHELSFRPGALGRSGLAAASLATALVLAGHTAPAATNLLVNPGFEAGSLNGWTGFYTPGCSANCSGGAVESTDTLVYNNGNPNGASNVLSRTGQFVGKEYGQFIGPGNMTGIYQDAVAGPGSIWSAGGWALSHHQDLLSGGNTFWFEVSFRDSGNSILALYKSGANNGGLIAPLDAALTPDTWLELSVTNQMDISDLSYMLVMNNTSTFTAPPGTTKVRFQVVFSQTTYDGGSVYFDDLTLTKIAGSDPDISVGPVSLRRVEGQTATFSVTAAGGSTLHYQWIQNGTNILTDGPNITGATSATLAVSSLTLDDAGEYSVRVSDNAGSVESSAVVLTVVTAAEASNVLVNPGFETGREAPWFRFNGGGLHTSNDYYYQTTIPVDVFEGYWVSQTYYNGNTWNGIFQDVPASPGQVFTADASFRVQAEDPISGGNTCWLEVSFRDSAPGEGNILHLYDSMVIDSAFPTSTWIDLAATNLIATWGDWSIAGNAKYLVAPPGTAKIRYQVTFRGVAGGGGSVWYDALHLMEKIPVTVVVSLNGANARLSFPTQIGVQYQILFKNELTDSEYQVLTTLTGDLSGQAVVPDPVGTGRRFYIVNTL